MNRRIVFVRASFNPVTIVFVISIVVLALQRPVDASDALTRARDLYSSASYQEALTVLAAIPAGGGSPETIEVLQYRVFCLVALDRKEEARNVMAALIATAPDYHMSEQDASPRVRAMFTAVRRSMLPSIVLRTYTDAKAAFDRRDADAAARFERVLALLQDADAAADPALANLATVASGFRDLSLTLASPLARPAAPAPRAAAVTQPAVAAIVPPVPVSQSFPPMQLREEREWDGEVELLIDDKGRVISARMRKSIHPLYDAQLLRVAKKWTYKPALKNDAPTQMTTVVAIHLDSRPPCSTQRVRRACRPDSN